MEGINTSYSHYEYSPGRTALTVDKKLGVFCDQSGIDTVSTKKIEQREGVNELFSIVSEMPLTVKLKNGVINKQGIIHNWITSNPKQAKDVLLTGTRQDGTIASPSTTLHNAIPIKFSETSFDAYSDKVVAISSLKLKIDGYTVHTPVNVRFTT